MTHVPLPEKRGSRPLSTCGDDACDRGWILVDDGYVERVWPYPDPKSSDPGDIAAWHEQCASINKVRAGASNTVKPCDQCRSVEYDQWKLYVSGWSSRRWAS
jgi:hypothetical protein